MKKINDGRKYTREEITLISQSAIGKTLREIEESSIYTFEDKNKSGKGGFGQLIENYLFGMENNSDSEPDFVDAGIELKVTPYKKIKGDKLSAKERLVLNIIDFNNEYKNDFKSSHFWFKNNKIQLLWYLWEEGKDKLDYTITNEKLLELANSEDIKQIEEDWNTIINKIKNGKAHEISEADTMYLGACTKGANSSSTRTQPFSDIPAMQRAFCFKTSYMTELVRKYIGDYSDVEKLIKNPNNTFMEYINIIIKKHIGKSQNELMKEFNIDSKSKSLNNILISRMFNIKGTINKTEEFQKANIVPKTVRIEANGRIKESISFPYFEYTELVKQDWETCDLKEELETTKYLFFVFKKEKNEYIFKGVKLWNVPELIIESYVKDLWIDTYNKVLKGEIVKSVSNGIRKTNFMGMSDNKICHLRPHGQNREDTCSLPTPDKLTGATEYTKYCFWINNTYIRDVLSEFNN